MRDRSPVLTEVLQFINNSSLDRRNNQGMLYKASFLIAAGVVAGMQLANAQTPSISAGGIINAASFDVGKPVAPGSLVAIFGNDMAPGLAQADSVPLSTS